MPLSGPGSGVAYYLSAALAEATGDVYLCGGPTVPCETSCPATAMACLDLEQAGHASRSRAASA